MESIVIKLSGEIFELPYDREKIAKMANILLGLRKRYDRLILITGGGNILRGRDFLSQKTAPAVEWDYLGMEASIMNSSLLANILSCCAEPGENVRSVVPENYGMPCRLHEIPEVPGVYCCGGGLGKTGYSTDTFTALTAIRYHAKILWMKAGVDGVMEKDPRVCPPEQNRLIPELTYAEMLEAKSGIFDLAATAELAKSDVVSHVIRADEPVLIQYIQDGIPGTTVHR